MCEHGESSKIEGKLSLLIGDSRRIVEIRQALKEHDENRLGLSLSFLDGTLIVALRRILSEP